jgi:hypothetical protein
MAVYPGNNCAPRLISVDNSCGCTLTRASIQAMTPDIFEAQGFTETRMDRIIGQTTEARMAGVPERGLTDLFLSRTIPLKTTTLFTQGDRSVISPFVLRPQRSVVNAIWFKVTAGVVDPNAGTGNIPASAWDLTVQNEGSAFASPLVNIERYFLPGRLILVLYADPVTKVAQTVQFTIIQSINADSGGVSIAKLVVQPPFTASGWTSLTTQQKAVYQPTHGVLIPLTNSVSNFESWCYNDPSENTMKLLVYWLQTCRQTFCYNDEYVKALTAPLTSDFFKKFRTLELAKQRKRQEMLAEAAYYNTIFYGQKINEQQTPNTYTNLPQVVDPANPSCLLEYKANTEGWYTQLNNCGRVFDNQGAALNVDVLKSVLYTLKRNRQTDSGNIDRIDGMSDRFFCDGFLTFMVQYYQKKYGMQYTRFFKAGEAIKFQDQVLWNYNVYDFPDEALSLCLITDTYFDDRLAVFTEANGGMDATRGRQLWLIDWSDAQIGLAGTAAASRQTNIADNLYNCVVTPNVNHYQLNSKTICAMIEVPSRHAIFDNIALGCPIGSATPCLPSS